MVRIFSSNIIDMQRNQGMIYEPLEELVKQVDVKIAHCALHKIHFVLKAWPPRTV